MDIIFDIDGTLMNRDHRLHWLKSPQKNWEEFFANIANDTPYEDMRYLLLCLYENEGSRIIFCSGRSTKYRAVTLNQIKKLLNFSLATECSENEPILYMRKEGDRRQDSVVKSEILDYIRGDGFDPKIVFDDREQVVKMWRNRGLRCLQVSDGDF